VSVPHTLFEVSWEVCNKVGGIHTVVSTKAKTLVERFGDDYVAIGPWLLSSTPSSDLFEEDPSYGEFCESCRAMRVPVRVGRWKIPGRPLTILVEFSSLFAEKDAILAKLWESYKVDSLFGAYDYLEPVLFGHAAGMVIEKWWLEEVAPRSRAAVAQFHEWMTGSGLLYLKDRVPAIGTVFTTHATVLGRSISSSGLTPIAGLDGRTPEEAATALGVRSKHSIESICAIESDVFTTVSDLTADEAEVFFHRRAAPILPNGIDLDVIDELAGTTPRAEAEAMLRDLAHRFLGESASEAALICLSGRYEFHNKGIDLLLDALAAMKARPGRQVVLFLLVPAGNSGMRNELVERMKMPLEEIRGSAAAPLGISTHSLFDFEHDPIHRYCARLGLDNAHGSRVKIIQVPVYLPKGQAPFHLAYEGLLRAMDLSCFPSFYEPWGYTPEESLAVGVPTVTTDLAGFGRWAGARDLDAEDGVYVLPRERVRYAESIERLSSVLETFVTEKRDKDETAAVCRDTARLTAWSDLILLYYEAFDRAVAQSLQRSPRLAPPALRKKIAVPVAPSTQGIRPRLARFEVSATLPEELRGLERLARNYWWSWDAQATELFRELFPAKWASAHHNAVSFLRDIYPEDLEKMAADAKYVERLKRVLARFDAYMSAAGAEFDLEAGPRARVSSKSEASPERAGDRATERAGDRARDLDAERRNRSEPGPRIALSPKHPVAYFCAEFGIHESLKMYSGGLGILAGDHLKSASDMNLPLVAVGLFYRSGYITQRLTSAGEQISSTAENDPRNLPLELVLDEEGKPLEVDLQLPSSRLILRAWRVAVGRVSLYLLDTNVPGNRPEDRDITRQLYGGDHEVRLRQEIALGRGGVRLLARLGIEPAVFHINEGHAAFLALERVGRHVREQSLTFDEAREIVRASTVFTTHTPVPAGHDRFSEDLIRRYFSDVPQWVGVPWDKFIALGQAEDDRGDFNMTYLALNFAGFANGVSELHGKVSQRLLHPFWPRLLESEVPVSSITNGVHLPSWTNPEVQRIVGASEGHVRGVDFERAAPSIEDRALWDVKQRAKSRMLSEIRARLEESFFERGDSPSVLNRMLDGIQPDCLWLGFARRFAPYKRAQLLFRDPARLKALLDHPDHPLRVVFAGKAHPNDKLGLEILKKVAEMQRSDDYIGKVFFVEEYDIELARSLVQGVDAWLNNPIRPLEASGTSGMKVAANGGLNLSVLDGWWVEAHDGKNGWSIGGGRVHSSQALQDELDGDNLYRLLEEELLPAYFRRDDSALPREWLARIKHNFLTIPPQFNTDRMVAEYRDRAYAPLSKSWFHLTADRGAPARALALRHALVRKGFADVKILGAHIADLTGIQVGDWVDVRVDVDLGPLSPEDVVVELVLGHTNGGTDLHNRIIVTLEPPAASSRAARPARDPRAASEPPALLPTPAVALAHAALSAGATIRAPDASSSSVASESSSASVSASTNASTNSPTNATTNPTANTTTSSSANSATHAPSAAPSEPSTASGSPGGARAFEGSHRMERSGSFAYGIRVRARSASEHDAALRDLVLWA
jgi:phosphorylase/glycogen(starch) synthase